MVPPSSSVHVVQVKLDRAVAASVHVPAAQLAQDVSVVAVHMTRCWPATQLETVVEQGVHEDELVPEADHVLDPHGTHTASEKGVQACKRSPGPHVGVEHGHDVLLPPCTVQQSAQMGSPD